MGCCREKVEECGCGEAWRIKGIELDSRVNSLFSGRMAFRLKADEGVADGVRRIAQEQIAKAAEEAGSGLLPNDEAIHQCRKRCKKIRALLRLVRPGMPELYAEENRFFRDAARELSELRDADVLIEAYDGLLMQFEGAVDRQELAPIRRKLTLRRKGIAENSEGQRKSLETFRGRMLEAVERVADWKMRGKPLKTLRDGLLKTYRRGGCAMERCEGVDPVDDMQFHEWRKRAKYSFYHFRILRDYWPRLMTALWRDFKKLSDILGNDHDLAVFRQALLGETDTFKDPGRLDVLLELIDRRRGKFHRQAFALGRRLYALKPKSLGRLVEASAGRIGTGNK